MLESISQIYSKFLNINVKTAVVFMALILDTGY